MRFVLPYYIRAGTKEEVLEKWFTKSSYGQRRSRLHGYRMWKMFCEEEDIDLEHMLHVLNPGMTVAHLVSYLDDLGFSEHMIKEASVAVRELLQYVRPDAKQFCENCPMLKSLIDGLATGVRRKTKYRQIWKLSTLLNHIKNGPPSEELTWKDLTARVAALLMIFVPCRPITMLRMDPTQETWARDGQSVEIPAREKMDKGGRVSAAVIRALPDKELCPLTHYLLLKDRARQMGLTGVLWASEAGNPYKSSAAICHHLKRLLAEAGIPSEYTAYSIRHATITALFESGLSEIQVNAFTGHSNNSHTAVTSYYHLDSVWAGLGLAASVGLRPKASVIADAAIKAIEEDNRVNLKDEGFPDSFEDTTTRE